MFIKYIQDILAQACGALDRYPLYLVLDKASIHNEEKILEAFHDNGCQELVEVWKMPAKAAKGSSRVRQSQRQDRVSWRRRGTA